MKVIISDFSDILVSKFEKTQNKEIISMTSRYLAGAKDRDGGKKERDEIKTKNQKSNEISCCSSENLQHSRVTQDYRNERRRSRDEERHYRTA